MSQASIRLKTAASVDSLASRDDGSSSDDQSMDNKSYNTAIVKEEGYSDDESSLRNSSRSGLKDQNQNVRAKNREHAKNTRIRKKNYIETLKENIKTISTTRDNRDKERKTAISRLAEQTLLRKQSVSAFFNYRASVETSAEVWGGVLESDFTCVMPVTPYRSFPPYQVFDGRRQLVGAAAMVYDTMSFYVMLYSMLKVRPGPGMDLPKIGMVFDTSQDTSIMTGDSYMCRWSMRTDGLVAQGSPFELQQIGMMAAQFSAGGAKLRHVELSLDVMSFMQQLRRSTGRDVFQQVVPNTAFPLDLAVDLTHPTYNIQEQNTNTATYGSNANGSNGGSNSNGGVNGSAYPTYAKIVMPSNTILNNNHIIQNHHNTTFPTTYHTSLNTNTPTNTINTSNTNNTTTFSREGAMESFLGTAEARAVVGAAEPYLLLFTNQRFQALFRTRSVLFTDCSFPLFASLIRRGDNSGRAVAQIGYYLQSGLPCTGILYCAPASHDGQPQPSFRCVCNFYPLFANGSVQQYMISFDSVDSGSTITSSTGASVPGSVGNASCTTTNSVDVGGSRSGKTTRSGHSNHTAHAANHSHHSHPSAAPSHAKHYQELRHHTNSTHHTTNNINGTNQQASSHAHHLQKNHARGQGDSNGSIGGSNSASTSNGATNTTNTNTNSSSNSNSIASMNTPVDNTAYNTAMFDSTNPNTARTSTNNHTTKSRRSSVGSSLTSNTLTQSNTGSKVSSNSSGSNGSTSRSQHSAHTTTSATAANASNPDNTTTAYASNSGAYNTRHAHTVGSVSSDNTYTLRPSTYTNHTNHANHTSYTPMEGISGRLPALPVVSSTSGGSSSGSNMDSGMGSGSGTNSGDSADNSHSNTDSHSGSGSNSGMNSSSGNSSGTNSGGESGHTSDHNEAEDSSARGSGSNSNSNSGSAMHTNDNSMRTSANNSHNGSNDNSASNSNNQSIAGSPLQYDFELPDTPPELPLLLPLPPYTSANNTIDTNNNVANSNINAYPMEPTALLYTTNTTYPTTNNTAYPSTNGSAYPTTNATYDMQGINMHTDSVAQFQDLQQEESSTNLTDLDIDEKFFDQYT